MASYLITGCSRGLGLELTRQLLSQPASAVSTVISTARSATPPAQLEALIKSSGGRAHFVQLDVQDEKSIASAVQKTSQILGGGRDANSSLDVLVNNAGVQIHEAGGAASMHALTESFNINVLGVHNVSSAFLPLLQRGRAKKLVNVTSTLGSISLVNSFAAAPFPAYKVTKAALNMMTVQYSMQLRSKGFTVFCVSPGWLQTDLGGKGADLPVETGAKAVVDIVMKASPEKDNGAFRNIHVPGWSLYSGSNPSW